MNRTVLAVAGILGGLLLAALLIFSATPTPKLEVEFDVSTKTPSAPPHKSTNSSSAKPIPATPPQRATQRIEAPKRTTAPPRPEPNPIAEIHQEEPIDSFDGANVHIVVQAHARWGPVMSILSRSNDPMAMDIKRRVHELRMEMMAMRRNPEGIDIDELSHRQRIILTELRQIPSWGPELAESASRVENVLDAIGED